MDEREENMIERYNDIITYPYDQQTPPIQTPHQTLQVSIGDKGRKKHQLRPLHSFVPHRMTSNHNSPIPSSIEIVAFSTLSKPRSSYSGYPAGLASNVTGIFGSEKSSSSSGESECDRSCPHRTCRAPKPCPSQEGCVARSAR